MRLPQIGAMLCYPSAAMGREQADSTHVTLVDAPLAEGERRMGVDEFGSALAHIRPFQADAARMQELRRILGEDLCVPVHLMSDTGLLREVAARIHRGDLELRARRFRIPVTFPTWKEE